MTPEEQLRQVVHDWIKLAPVVVQMALRPEHVTGLVDMLASAIRTAENEARAEAEKERDIWQEHHHCAVRERDALKAFIREHLPARVDEMLAARVLPTPPQADGEQRNPSFEGGAG